MVIHCFELIYATYRCLVLGLNFPTTVKWLISVSLNGVFALKMLHEPEKFYDIGKQSVIPLSPQDGLQTLYFDNGKKKQEGHIKNGKRDGFWTFWHENGKKSGESRYKDGKPDGLSVGWHKNGQKKWEVKFIDGDKISANYWNSKGEPFDSLEEALK